MGVCSIGPLLKETHARRWVFVEDDSGLGEVVMGWWALKVLVVELDG